MAPDAKPNPLCLRFGELASTRFNEMLSKSTHRMRYRMRTNRTLVVWTVCAFAGLIFVLGAIALAAIPTTAEFGDCHQGKDSGFVVCIATVIESHDKLVVAIGTGAIAVFTLVLGVATVYLWQAGERQIDLTRASAEMQLRAYVSLETQIAPSITKYGLEATLNVINYGQTPASDVQTWSMLQVVAAEFSGFTEAIRWTQPEFINAPEIIHGDKHAIFPRSSEYLHKHAIALTDRESANLKDGNFARFYFWGEVRYRDAFNQPRRSRFRMYWQKDQWQCCESGNDFT